MTDLNQRLRTAMTEPQTSTTGSGASWAAVTATADRRRSHRRLTERILFVFAVGAAGAVGIAVATDSDGLGQDQVADAAASNGVALSPLVFGVVAAAAIAVGLLLLVRTRTFDESSLVVEIDRPLRYLAALGVVASLAIPVTVHGYHLDDIGNLDAAYAEIPGLTIVQRDAVASPFAGSERPQITLRVFPESPGDTGGETAVTEALDGVGFQAVAQDLRIREVGEGTDRSRISSNPDGSYEIEITRWPEWARSWLPLTTILSTYLLTISTGVFWEARLGRRLGTVLSLVVGIQVWLVARAMWRAQSLLDAYETEFGRFEIERVSQRPIQQWAPEDAELYRSVGSVAGDLYPLGSWSAMLLAIPWAAGAALATSGKRRALLLNAGLLCIIGVALGFAGINNIVLAITD